MGWCLRVSLPARIVPRSRGAAISTHPTEETCPLGLRPVAFLASARGALEIIAFRGPNYESIGALLLLCPVTLLILLGLQRAVSQSPTLTSSSA